MNFRLSINVAILFALMGLVFPVSVCVATDAQVQTIVLPKPETDGGMPLMKALSLRKAERSFSSQDLAPQELSNLLWATWGINRSDGKRTAPSASNKQQIAVYITLQTGVWYYDAQKNALTLALAGDYRAKFGGWPVTLVYAAPESDPLAGMHAGSLYQNAGLYCASAGLSNVVKRTGSDALNGILPLPGGYKVYVVQSVGHPK